MMLIGKNPCDCCHAKQCDVDCVLYSYYGSEGNCENTDCFVHYESGCSLSLDTKCKASTCYTEEE